MDTAVDKKAVLSALSESAKILCSLHYSMTLARRLSMSTHVVKAVREIPTESKSHKYLFGQSLSERIKAARLLEKSGKDMTSCQT